MEPKVVSIGTEDGELNFELVDTEVSVVNSIRRIALTQIKSLVFRGFPHRENLINIVKNTSKFNNEYLKHRIQCIPICYSDETNFDAFINQYEVKLNVSNDTNNIRYVTTEDLILYDKKSIGLSIINITDKLGLSPLQYSIIFKNIDFLLFKLI